VRSHLPGLIHQRSVVRMASEFWNRRQIMTFVKGLNAPEKLVVLWYLVRSDLDDCGDVTGHSTIQSLCWRIYLSLMSKMPFSPRIQMHLPASS
jgi:hypothetical protein